MEIKLKLEDALFIEDALNKAYGVLCTCNNNFGTHTSETRKLLRKALEKIPMDMPISNVSFEDALNKHVEKVKENMKKKYPENPLEITVDLGTKYYRISQNLFGTLSVLHFVDSTNGNILKAAGWKAPAKGKRGNIFDENTTGGDYYYAR